MSLLKGVIIGCGYFSQFHLEAWSRIKNVQFVGVCDIDSDKAQTIADQFGIPEHRTDFVSLLNDTKPDFVDIVTRPETHLELVRQAVAIGVNVICQKPLAPTFEQSQQLVEMAESAGVRFMVHENFRFQPWYREMRRLLDKNVMGDQIHNIQFRCRTGDGWQPDAYLARQPYFREMPRFLIYETGVHFIDTFRFLGGEIEGVYASLRKLNPEIAGEDAGTVLFEFANGAEGIWDANRYHETTASDPRYTFGQATIESNRGTIRLYDDGRLTTQTQGGSEVEHRYGHQKLNFAGDCVFSTQQHFVDCLLQNRPFETSGGEYLKTLAVQEAVYQSAAERMPVRGLSRSGGHDANH